MNPQLLTLPTSIATDRLLLRPWAISDVSELHKLQQESWEQLNKWYGGILSKEQTTKDDIQVYINNALSSWYNRDFLEFAAFSKDTGQLIGACSFHHLDWTVPKGRIGYIVRKSASGKGYATEMANIFTRYGFQHLIIKRLELRTAPGNQASCMVPRKLGFQFLTVFEKNKVGAQGDLWDLEIHVRFNADNLPHLHIDYSQT